MTGRSSTSTSCLPALRPTRAIGPVTRADCQALVHGWVNAGLSPRTVVRIAASLRSMFQHGLDAELICRNPAARLKLPHIDTVERPRLTNDDLERLAAALGPQQAVFMWCGAVLGLRWAETAGLTLGAVDTARATVSVRSQIDRHGQVTAPKTVASRRTLAAPRWLVDDLPARRGVAAADLDTLIFVNRNGAPLDYNNWRPRIWLPATTETELAGLRYHDLRSLAASALVAAGVDVRTAMHRLGHTTPHPP